MTVTFPKKSAMVQSLEAEAERMCLVHEITQYAQNNEKKIELPLNDSKSMAESRRLDGTMKRLTTLITENQPTCVRYILDFGNIILGQSRKRQFNVSNIGFPAVSFDLDKRTCNAAGFQVEPDKVGKLPGLPEPEGIDIAVVFQTHPKLVNAKFLSTRPQRRVEQEWRLFSGTMMSSPHPSSLDSAIVL